MILALALAISTTSPDHLPTHTLSSRPAASAGKDVALELIFDLVDADHNNRITRVEMYRARKRFAAMSETDRRILVGRIVGGLRR